MKLLVHDKPVVLALQASPAWKRSLEWSDCGMDGYGVLSVLHDILSDPAVATVVAARRIDLHPLAITVLKRDLATAMRRMIQ